MYGFKLFDSNSEPTFFSNPDLIYATEKVVPVRTVPLLKNESTIAWPEHLRDSFEQLQLEFKQGL